MNPEENAEKKEGKRPGKKPFSHDSAAGLLQLLENLGQQLAHQLFHLVLLLALLSPMLLLLLLLASMILASVLLLSAVILPSMLLLPTVRLPSMLLSRLQRLPALQVNVYSPRILLRPELQSQLLTQLLHLGLNPLHMTRRVISLANNCMEMLLPARLIRPDALLQNPLRLLDVQPVQIDGIRVHLSRRVVLAEDVLARLAVVVISFGVVLLGFAGVLLRSFVVIGTEGFLGLYKGVLLVRASFHSHIYMYVCARLEDIRFFEERNYDHRRAW